MALKEYGLGIVIGGALASSFKTSFKNANSTIAGVDKSIQQLSKSKLDIKSFKTLSKDAKKNKVELDRLGRSLKKAGIDVNNLDQDSRSLRRSLVNLKKVSKIDIKLNGIKNQFAEQKASIVATGASMYGLIKTVGTANNVLKAQGEIASLGISTKGIDAITRSGHNLSMQYGQITAPALIKASYDIKSGISSLSDSGVKDMTRMAAVTGVATKSSTEEMTKLYALGYGIFREDFSSDMDFGKKFSGAISGAVQAFRTDGSDLAQGISNIGASAKAMGVSLEEELSIIGLAKGAFNSASEAGSGYRAFLSGTGKAQKALGLEFVDSNGKMLPMVQILDKIKKKYGDLELSEIDELKSAFGSDEAIKIITALLPKTKELKKAQADLRKSMDAGMAKSTKMAQDMQKGFAFEKIGNAMSYMSFTIGKSVAPAFDTLAVGITGVANGIAWLDSAVPGLIPITAGLAGGIIGLATAVKLGSLAKLGFSFALGTVRKSLLLNTAANNTSMLSFNRMSISSMWATAKMKTFNAMSTIATAKQWLFNGALMANPIGLAVAGVAALGVAGVALYKNFEPFTNLIDGIWDKSKKFFGWIGDKLSGVGGALSSIGGFLGFGGDDKENNIINKTENIEDNKSFFSWFGGDESPVKKAIAPVAVASTLAAAPLPEYKLNEQSLNIPSNEKIQELKAEHINNTTNSTVTPVNKNYTIQVSVQNPNSSIDIADAVKQAIKDIESDNHERNMGDNY
jgi:TP901 family phage tail tape measure protein